MKTVKKTFQVQLNYDLTALGEPDRILFFDIETTGLSPASSHLYLIGAGYFLKDVFCFTQWFAESFREEEAVLKAFFDHCRDFDLLVHFNGNHFDLPYLRLCAGQYGLSFIPDEMKSFDIYQEVRKENRILQLEHCRQKCIEAFLGIQREDRYNGGQLIDIYEEYKKTADPELLNLLLLHNEEDLLGMPEILPVLHYGDVLYGRSSYEITEVYRNRSGSRLFLTLKFPFTFPVSVSREVKEDLLLHFHDDVAELRLPLQIGPLKYFYPDHRNYDYLPEEDKAIHHSLSQYVDKKHRIPAKPETCYTKMEGFFIPEIKNTGLPVFFREYKDRQGYCRFDEDMLPNYLSCLLDSLHN